MVIYIFSNRNNVNENIRRHCFSPTTFGDSVPCIFWTILRIGKGMDYQYMLKSLSEGLLKQGKACVYQSSGDHISTKDSRVSIINNDFRCLWSDVIWSSQTLRSIVTKYNQASRPNPVCRKYGDREKNSKDLGKHKSKMENLTIKK